MKICLSCGTETTPRTRFCGHCGAALEAESEPNPEQPDPSLREALRSRLLIIRELGRTSMSRVYEAEELELGRLVALKVLAPDLARDPEMVQRFKREARTAAALSHPHIVPIHAVGSQQGTHYFTMTLLTGGSILERMGNPLSVSEIIDIIGPLASALHYAHQHGVIHRDVKPQNVLFDEHGTPILVDFGIAKALYRTQITAAPIYMGTPHYSSPEQARGRAVDARSDLYSLGIIFYQLATGVLPFDAEDPLSIIYQHVNENPKSPSLINPVLPTEISHVISKLIRKNPDERFQSGEELLVVLDRFKEQAAKNTERLIGRSHRSKQDDKEKTEPKPRDRSPARRRPPWRAYTLILLCLLALIWYLGRPSESVNPIVEPVEPPQHGPIVEDLPVEESDDAWDDVYRPESPDPSPLTPQKKPTQKTAPKSSVKRENQSKQPARGVKTPIYWGGFDPALVQRIDRILESTSFLRIPEGTFKMGSRTQFLDDSWAVHEVHLSEFELSATETTQELWQAVMGTNPACNKGSKNPIELVNWVQVQEFLTCLNETQLGEFRLPTEAEWEYAARAGDKPYADILPGGSAIREEGWYKNNSQNISHPVAKKKPNNWGLYDMRGNVWEWCADYYGEDYYEISPFINPQGPEQGTYRVIRGGSWNSESNDCRAVNRAYRNPYEATCEIGFRLVRVRGIDPSKF